MNIFYLHEDPVKAAKLQYNKHVVKMILESAQMLCTAVHLSIKKCKEPLAKYPDGILHTGFSEPPQCMPDEYKVEGDSLRAYWQYYIGDKSSICNIKKEKLYDIKNIEDYCSNRYNISRNSSSN